MMMMIRHCKFNNGGFATVIITIATVTGQLSHALENVKKNLQGIYLTSVADILLLENCFRISGIVKRKNIKVDK